MEVSWYASPEDVKALLVKAPFRWFVAGGWAIDDFTGHTTRYHADVDIAVFRKDVNAIFSYLDHYELHVVSGPGEFIADASPTSLIPPRHSVWVKERSDDHWLFELLFNDTSNREWLYRRDHTITLPLSKLGVQRNGYELLAPEVVLLYKSKNPRPIDEMDFSNALLSLPSSSRQWFKRALQSVSPNHPWIGQL